jgi:hypothetical protein
MSSETKQKKWIAATNSSWQPQMDSSGVRVAKVFGVLDITPRVVGSLVGIRLDAQWQDAAKQSRSQRRRGL